MLWLMLQGSAWQADFAISKQEPLRKQRKRDGMELPVCTIKDISPLSTEGKDLLRKVTLAGDRGDWQHVRSLFDA